MVLIVLYYANIKIGEETWQMKQVSKQYYQ